ncbi:MAG: coagulation factor 5/8 type domain protein [Bacteroidota bacterium]|jgi:hypothetical protein|nr:coagulation factor 5/8 type domain protein [Bacteroidota bacterium]
MRAKISLIIVALFIMACGSEKSNPDTQTSEQQAAPVSEKFILKANNSQFVSLGENNMLVPNQTDPTKATVFEKIDLGNGRCSLKAANGKFVSADRSRNSVLYADKDVANEWETFEIVALDETHVHIKTTEPMFVTSDKGKGDILIGDRQTGRDWETFEMISQN